MQVAANLLFRRLRDSAKPLPLQALQVRSHTWTCDVNCTTSISVGATRCCGAHTSPLQQLTAARTEQDCDSEMVHGLPTPIRV